MEHQKILNLLNEASDSKFVIRKWNIVNDQSNTNYDVGDEINYNAEVLNLCAFNYANISVRDDIITIGHQITQVAFKNCALFTKCIIKIDGTIIDDAKNVDLVMPKYSLIQNTSNHSETTKCF